MSAKSVKGTSQSGKETPRNIQSTAGLGDDLGNWVQWQVANWNKIRERKLELGADVSKILEKGIDIIAPSYPAATREQVTSAVVNYCVYHHLKDRA